MSVLRRLARSTGFRKIKRCVFGALPIRRLATRNFTCGRIAFGERNSYNFPAGWITVDWKDADVTLSLLPDTQLPFAAASQRVAYSAHLMEHLEDAALSRLLDEICRVLRPDGALRLEVPDAEKLVAAYRACDQAFLDRFRDGWEANLCARLGLGREYLEDHIIILGEIANYIAPQRDSGHIPVYASKDDFERELAKGLDSFNGWAQGLKTDAQRQSGGHANALTYEKLAFLLRQAGFREVRRASYGRTEIKGLRLGRGIARLYDAVPEVAERSFYSLYIEAFK